MKGFTASTSRDKMGLRTVPIGELNFENCFVPTENRLGKEGAGFSISNHSLEYERCSILASQLGAMERQLETAIQYAKTRQQFGQPIGKFQSVSNRIVDMKLRIEAARLLLYKTAWLKKNGQPAMMEAALLKLYLSESFIESSFGPDPYPRRQWIYDRFWGGKGPAGCHRWRTLCRDFGYSAEYCGEVVGAVV